MGNWISKVCVLTKWVIGFEELIIIKYYVSLCRYSLQHVCDYNYQTIKKYNKKIFVFHVQI